MGEDYLILGNSDFMFAYDLNNTLSELDFTYVFGEVDYDSDIVLEDNEGNQWNVFGEAVSGPRQGENMSVSSAMMGQWFSIAAFYNTDIFGR